MVAYQGPGYLVVNIQALVFWPISIATFFGQFIGQGTLANVQGQVPLDQCSEPGILVNVQNQLLWSISKANLLLNIILEHLKTNY